MMLRIGIDAQSLQTENSKNRGIGRYSENLVNAILKLDLINSYKIFFNNQYDEPKIQINSQTSQKSVSYKNDVKIDYEKFNNLIQFLEYYNSNLDILHILSTAEGYPSPLPVCNNLVERMDSKICTTVYDIIPLLFPDHYFQNLEFKKEYFRQLKTIFHSDVLFSISESTKNDLINILEIDPKKIFTINGASSNDFKFENISEKDIYNVKKKFGIKRKFILYTGGIEFRKNIENSITAFSKLDVSILENISFVIVCKISDYDRHRLTNLVRELGIEQNTVFTGYVSDKTLNMLYNCCDVFLFPSLYEGLGIPILEAMQCHAPVISSNTSSMIELVGDSEFLFDPYDIDDIARLISRYFTDPELRKRCKNNSIKRLKLYSWEKTAKKVIETYASLRSNHLDSTFYHKPKIAYFSPLPPNKSGIANYNASLLPLLSKYYDIDLFTDNNYECNDPFLTNNFNIFTYDQFEILNQAKKYNTTLYQFGNSGFHSFMFKMLEKHPGIVVMHDLFLSGVLFWDTGRIGKIDDFVEELVYSHGNEGQKAADKAKKGLISWEQILWDFPINKRILDCATHVMIHSEWDKKKILELYPQLGNKLSLIHQFAPIKQFSAETKHLARMSLDYDESDFLICSFGFVVPTKKIDSIIKNLEKFLKNNSQSKYIVVGELEGQYGELVRKLVGDLGLSSSVIFTDFICEETYRKYLSICDVCISLRTKTRAGTSASINHSLGAGIPTIISDVEPFDEFSDDVVIKVKPEEEKNLPQIISSLYNDKNKRNILGNNAKTFAENTLSKELCVEKYVQIINTMVKTT